MPALLHSAFYRFATIADPRAAADALRAAAVGLLGSIVVAHEGVNGTVAGDAAAIAAFEAALRDGTVLDGALRGLRFRRSACTTAPFARLSVAVKPEIVALGDVGQVATPDEHDASHVAPRDWRALVAREDVVLIDNRNHFEVRLGRFRGAVDPGVHNFRDFTAWVEANAPAWLAARRPVAMYCTGGIRCDKTAPWLRGLGLDVRQLDGGILGYFAAIEDAHRDWDGECFVFDNRVALDTRLRETATTAGQVFDSTLPDEAWRLQRARRLAAP